MTIVALLRRLVAQFRELAREDIALGVAEMRAKLNAIVVALVLAAVGGVVGLLVIVALTACFTLALSLVVPAWLAALIVAIVYAIVAACLLLVARTTVTRALPLFPKDTVKTVKEHIQWAQALAISNKT